MSTTSKEDTASSAAEDRVPLGPVEPVQLGGEERLDLTAQGVAPGGQAAGDGRVLGRAQDGHPGIRGEGGVLDDPVPGKGGGPLLDGPRGVQQVEVLGGPLHLAGDGPLGERVHVVEVAEHRAEGDARALGHGGGARVQLALAEQVEHGFDDGLDVLLAPDPPSVEALQLGHAPTVLAVPLPAVVSAGTRRRR